MSIRLGDYQLPRTFHVAGDEAPRSIGTAKHPRRHGARQLQGYLDARRVRLEGTIVRGPLTRSVVVRDDLDDLRAALAACPADLYLYDDRYYRRCQCANQPEAYSPTAFGRFVDVSLELVAGDPFGYSTTVECDTWLVPGDGETRVLTAGGNAPAQPTFTCTVAGTGAVVLDVRLSNLTTGEAFELSASLTGGDVVVVDTLEETVTVGDVDRVSYFEGRFPQLNVGANTLELSVCNGDLSSVVTTWRNRWW